MAYDKEHTKHEKELKKKVEEREEELKKEKGKRKTLEDKIKSEAQALRKEFADRLLKLVTSGFGLVAALAWNEVIKEIVAEYIKPLFGESSGLISLIIYAVFVTIFAVLVTYNLSKVVGSKN